MRYASKAHLPTVPRPALFSGLSTLESAMYTYAATAVISASIAFAGAWQIQDARQHTRELENDQIRAAEALAAGNVSLTQAGAVIKAQSAATIRNGSIRRGAADSAVALDGLRKQSADALQAASASLAACIERATTLSGLLDQCGTAYQGLGERADRHVNDIKTLMDAWPR